MWVIETLGSLLLVAAAVAFAVGTRWLKRRAADRLELIQQAKVLDNGSQIPKESGWYRVTGPLRGTSDLKAPTDGIACICFAFVASERIENKQRDSAERVISTHVVTKPVVDQLECCSDLRIELGQLHLYLEPQETDRWRKEKRLDVGRKKDARSTATGREGDPVLYDILEKIHGEKTKGWFLNRNLNISETVLIAGDMVTVVGYLEVAPDGLRFVVSPEGHAVSLTGPG